MTVSSPINSRKRTLGIGDKRGEHVPETTRRPEDSALLAGVIQFVNVG